MLRRHTNALPELQEKQQKQEVIDITLADEKIVAKDEQALEIGGFDLMDGEEPEPVPISKEEPIGEQTTHADEEKERKGLKDQMRFSKLLPGAKGCMFINIPVTNESIEQIYTDLVKAKDQGALFENIAHFWPVQFTSKTEKTDFSQVFTRHFPPGSEALEKLQDRHWEIKIRNNGGLKEDAVVEWLQTAGLRRKVVHWTEEKDPSLKRLFVNACKCNLMFGFN